MDELINIFELAGTEALNQIPHEQFRVSFVQVILGLLRLVKEILLDDRDIHETNQYFAEIYEDIQVLIEHLQLYLETRE